jgi:hypothetical protein
MMSDGDDDEDKQFIFQALGSLNHVQDISNNQIPISN